MEGGEDGGAGEAPETATGGDEGGAEAPRVVMNPSPA